MACPGGGVITGGLQQFRGVFGRLGGYFGLSGNHEPFRWGSPDDPGGPDTADADHKNLIYATSNQSVAVVDSSGKVTAVGKGTCTITVASQAYSDVSCHVEVVVGGGQTASQPEPSAQVSGGYVIYVEETDPARVYPTYYLSEGEVAAMDPEQLQFVINQIYAKNGYIFETDSLQAMFEGQPWYQGITRDGKSLNFSALDQKNLRLLTSYRS